MAADTPEGWQFSPTAVAGRELTARLIGPLLGWLMHGPVVVGAAHLSELDAPAIICPTHASHLDFSAVRLALGSRHRRRLAAAAASDYFRMDPVRWFVAAWLGSFAFNRAGKGGAESISAAEALLDAGWHVLVFPEGTRTTTGEIKPFHPGVGLLARRARCHLVPVRIVGIRDVLPKGAKRPRRARVEVRIGAPLRPMPGEGARELTARLEAAVRAL
jgi:1-acyl-sn-glycerol-3-phosphate acyltransferase